MMPVNIVHSTIKGYHHFYLHIMFLHFLIIIFFSQSIFGDSFKIRSSSSFPESINCIFLTYKGFNFYHHSNHLNINKIIQQFWSQNSSFFFFVCPQMHLNFTYIQKRHTTDQRQNLKKDEGGVGPKN